MTDNNKEEYSNLTKSQEKSNSNNIQKRSLPNLLIPRKTWNIKKEKSQSSQNLFDQKTFNQNINNPIKLKSNLDKRGVIRNNLSENQLYKTSGNQLYKTSGTGFKKYNYKIKNFKKIENTNINNYTNINNDNYFVNESYENKDIEQVLLVKIDEIKKELEKNENTFIYNQKIMQKKMEEKENEINYLKGEILKEKTKFENMLNANNTKLNITIGQLKKEIESLKNKIQVLTEQNLENEKIIQDLENKNKENISKLIDVSQKYNILIEEKTKNFLEDDIKQYINELNQKINDQLNEINSLNEEMLYINQENRKLKTLTKEIIEARNETEIFFLDALNEAKKDLYKLKKEKDKRGCFFPTLKNYYQISNPKVDIRELTPEMREKILRNLFEKINKGYVEKNFRELSKMIQADLSDID